MGSYKWPYKSPNMGYKFSYPAYNPKPQNPKPKPLITTPEPPSKGGLCDNCGKMGPRTLLKIIEAPR